MLKGAQVRIVGGDMVENVLIGEPADGGRSFTLGIPKGDPHSWEDKKLVFFGRTFRTVGMHEEGIETNIPTPWHHKIRAVQLDTTGCVTVYERESFARHTYTDALMKDMRGTKADRAGLQPADEVTVLIPSCTTSDGYVPRVGDIIVPGAADFTFDSSTEQAQSASMAEFREQFPQYAVITSAAAELCGLLYDYQITAR